MNGAPSSPPAGRGRLVDLGEDALVSTVISTLARTATPAWLRVGPGDDAAVLDLRIAGSGGLDPGRLVVSTDTLVEGQDFRFAWSSGRDVGVKTAAQNLADIAAMGAHPLALVVSLAAPGDLSVDVAEGLTEGLVAECERAGAAVVGGDVSAAAQVVITGTALGLFIAGSAPVRRDGARVGDVVAIAGTTGDSAAGLAVLTAGLAPPAAPARDGVGGAVAVAAVLTAHRTPRPPYHAGPTAAAAGATAMIDTSDGLLRDAVRIATASAVLLDLDLERLPRSRHLDVVGAMLEGQGGRTDGPAGGVARQWLLTGGEDHALLACLPPGVLPEGFVAVGQVHAVPAGGEPGVRLNGRTVSGPLGWQHW